MTKILATADDAAEVLKNGQLVAFPTETVYGLGADACDDTAVARIFDAKGRPTFNPLIIHVFSCDIAEQYVEMTDQARILAEAFWPGPLTLVLPLKDGKISRLVTAGLVTVAIRVPNHPVARDMLKTFGGPVAAPSANLSGQISPTCASHVLQGLNGRIDAILDAGPCDVGLESTIIGFDPAPTLLRPGGLEVEKIESVLGHPLLQDMDPAAPRSPGQLLSHYAPKASVRLSATDVKPGEVLLGFGDVAADLNLSKTGDLVQAAANLFAYLHQLDARGAKTIAVSPIPEKGLGRAINDRLRRAAKPRSN
ncbi:L-threonylcarbamoyladenylate synthase [Parasulfitobacter algicola]|uniref:Threonylcarbamoyl-AMP synthase n=1 Tax=Parasulfitobacter algicola TaxID=2614809 RepID=A0ABX2ISN9_9RHOB|nr:L-threonylcarbamoyladenylate synthase [Sulfitobacter algicola]NSX53812.1 threonylcarbamoyl-AMP synthase [Sulfitobacter algicola]